jgi:hypothetical protein
MRTINGWTTAVSLPTRRATQPVRRYGRARKLDGSERQICRRIGGGEIASIIGILLKGGSKGYISVMVNTGKHRDGKNACQYNILSGQLRAKRRAIFTNQDELR